MARNVQSVTARDDIIENKVDILAWFKQDSKSQGKQMVRNELRREKTARQKQKTKLNKRIGSKLLEPAFDGVVSRNKLQLELLGLGRTRALLFLPAFARAAFGGTH